MKKNLDELMARLNQRIDAGGDPAGMLQALCETMQQELAGYDWVGFYLVDPQSPRELILGPYAGAPTDHTRIAFGEGICGQAADSGETFVIDDVSKQSNYLSCGINVKSEIVVPVFEGDRLVGELDIDSHTPAAFGEEDRRLCEAVAALLGPLCREAAAIQ